VSRTPERVRLQRVPPPSPRCHLPGGCPTCRGPAPRIGGPNQVDIARIDQGQSDDPAATEHRPEQPSKPIPACQRGANLARVCEWRVIRRGMAVGPKKVRVASCRRPPSFRRQQIAPEARRPHGGMPPVRGPVSSSSRGFVSGYPRGTVSASASDSVPEGRDEFRASSRAPSRCPESD